MKVLLPSAIAVICCAACAKTGESDKVEIEFWHNYAADTGQVDTLNTLIGEFEKENPNVTVNPVYQEWSALQKGVTLGASSGVLPDVLRGDIAFVPQFQSLNVLEEVGAYSDYAEVAGKVLKQPNSSNLMQNKALIIIDIQNDITKNCKGIIQNINKAIDWAVNSGIHAPPMHSVTTAPPKTRRSSSGFIREKLLHCGFLLFREAKGDRAGITHPGKRENKSAIAPFERRRRLFFEPSLFSENEASEPVGGLQKAEDKIKDRHDFDQRAFACSRRADYGNHLAFLNGEIDVLEHFFFPKAHRNVFKREHF